MPTRANTSRLFLVGALCSIEPAESMRCMNWLFSRRGRREDASSPPPQQNGNVNYEEVDGQTHPQPSAPPQESPAPPPSQDEGFLQRLENYWRTKDFVSYQAAESFQYGGSAFIALPTSGTFGPYFLNVNETDSQSSPKTRDQELIVSITRQASKVRDDPVQCAICLEDMKDRDLSRTACGHKFCTACISTWIATPSFSCPSCNQELRPLTNIG